MKALYNKIIPKPVRSGNTEVDRAFDDVRRSLQEIHKLLNVTQNTDGITVDGNIHCKSLYVEGDSIYIGGIKLAQPQPNQDAYYVTYNHDTNEFEYVGTNKTLLSKTADFTASFNNFIICNGTFTITLPAIGTTDILKSVSICNVGEGIITITGSGEDDTIYDGETIECIPGATLTLTAKTITTWILE